MFPRKNLINYWICEHKAEHIRNSELQEIQNDQLDSYQSIWWRHQDDLQVKTSNLKSKTTSDFLFQNIKLNQRHNFIKPVFWKYQIIGLLNSVVQVQKMIKYKMQFQNHHFTLIHITVTEVKNTWGDFKPWSSGFAGRNWNQTGRPRTVVDSWSPIEILG